MPESVQVEPVALLPTEAGCAVFLGDGKKVIVIYIDPSVATSINAALTGEAPVRPLTHDLFLMSLKAFGGEVKRVMIVSCKDQIFHGRLIMEAENEIMQRKIVEMDARPSDCLALAVRCGAPCYVVKSLWDQLEDMSQNLLDLRNQSSDS